MNCGRIAHSAVCDANRTAGSLRGDGLGTRRGLHSVQTRQWWTRRGARAPLLAPAGRTRPLPVPSRADLVWSSRRMLRRQVEHPGVGVIACRFAIPVRRTPGRHSEVAEGTPGAHPVCGSSGPAPGRGPGPHREARAEASQRRNARGPRLAPRPSWAFPGPDRVTPRGRWCRRQECQSRLRSDPRT